MLENSTQNKKEHRLVLVVAYAEFNKNLNENALKDVYIIFIGKRSN